MVGRVGLDGYQPGGIRASQGTFSSLILLIVPRRYFCCGAYCFMSWCLIFVLFAPYVCYHILVKFR